MVLGFALILGFGRMDFLPSLLPDRLDVESYVHFVPHDNAAASELGIPAHSEVVPIDDCGRVEAGAQHWPLVHAVFPKRRLPLSKVLDLEDNRIGNAPDGEGTVYSQLMRRHDLHGTALECELRVFC